MFLGIPIFFDLIQINFIIYTKRLIQKLPYYLNLNLIYKAIHYIALSHYIFFSLSMYIFTIS